MSTRIFFVTGTDTGVGKTVFTALLTRHLLEQGFSAAALKPICSGNRDDARALKKVLGNSLSLDEINPWHFRAPVAPLLAARKERRKVRLAQVVRHVKKIAGRFEIVVVEGAGGLLSPLGEDFDSRDLIAALQATPIVVAQNKIGAVSQVRLVLEALPKPAAREARVILMNPARADAASRTNRALLAAYVKPWRIREFPWLGERK